MNCYNRNSVVFVVVIQVILLSVSSQTTNTTETIEEDDDYSSGTVKLVIAITLAILSVLALGGSYYFIKSKGRDHGRGYSVNEPKGLKQLPSSVLEPLDEIQENQA
jgi:hypothetical protein